MLSFGLIPGVFNDYFVLPDDLVVVSDQMTLLTYAFLHGSLWHLVGNMVFLWVFADNVEDAFGHVRFIIFYVLCAIGAGYAYVLTDPTSQAPVIGASGAVAGIVAAYLMLHPRQKVWVLVLARVPLRLSAFWVLGFWVLFQVYAILVAQPGDEVAWWSHIGGLITGAILVVFLRRRGVPLFDRARALPAPAPLGKIDDNRDRR
ncbi:rhomboid family intramembrane serine protease [Bauldia litoralis]|uniref:Membrane associated serine protease, rhomboid family n=1 Tax=Bauldia litoralis TaxID=665467 RepID=A0A1G6ABZ8_9HYPH|nr:rhomboid family intramembrane serine protease [Bauldia litoralis]SDB05975.1 Membrane associated serine protease, rhomboid family [Bauldia litoralis]